MSGPGNLEYRKVKFFIGGDDSGFAPVAEIGADDRYESGFLMSALLGPAENHMVSGNDQSAVADHETVAGAAPDKATREYHYEGIIDRGRRLSRKRCLTADNNQNGGKNGASERVHGLSPYL
jgi:hypothetical protein